jgi:hypothetical protein
MELPFGQSLDCCGGGHLAHTFRHLALPIFLAIGFTRARMSSLSVNVDVPVGTCSMREV